MPLDRLLQDYERLSGIELIRATVKVAFPGNIALVSSFGTESAVLLDIVARIDPNVPVIFLSTGKLFEETLRYRRLLERRLGLRNLIEVEPDPADVACADPDGGLWARDPDRCCEIRKVRPLDRALQGYSAWITGRKRYHGGMRASLDKIEKVDGKIKINPLADWSPDDVDRWFDDSGLPHHPLALLGYRSVGCVTCTRKTQAWEGIRDGRWAGREKTECGIHRGS